MRRIPYTARTLAVVVFALAIRPAAAIYINPTPNASASNLAGTLTNAQAPQVGVVGDRLGPGGAIREFCSGTVIRSSVIPARDWVLTAGHCVGDGAVTPDDRGLFRATGPGGPLYFTDMMRRHPSYVSESFGAGLHNDVGLMRLVGSTGVEGVVLRRAPLFENNSVLAIGVGAISNTGALPITRFNDTGFGVSKRFASFNVSAVVPGNATFGANSYQYLRAGNATPSNPTRQICGGDSGGPSLFLAQIIGVHSYGLPGATNNACFGSIGGPMGDANTTLPFLHNWIDSFTQQALFWDAFSVDGEIIDSFEPTGGMTADWGGHAGYEGTHPVEYTLGETGLAAQWEVTTADAVEHPKLGLIDSDLKGWRHFNAIGVDNDGGGELWTDGMSSQGQIWLGGGPSVIARDFVVEGGRIVDQRWNSLRLGADFGVGLPDGSIVWSGLTSSTLGDLDTWMRRTLTLDLTGYPGEQTLTAYLLTAPEPGTLALLALGLATLRKRRG
jgi:hypothetical protein